MKFIQAFAYLLIILAFFVHHVPHWRAALEVTTDVYYNQYAEEIGLWE